MTFTSVVVNQEGLTPFQVEVLEAIETDFFNNVDTTHDRLLQLKKQFEAKGVYAGKEFLAVLDFFRFVNKAVVKSSYANPVDLADYFRVCDKKDKDSFYLSTNDLEDYQGIYVLESKKLIDDLGELKSLYNVNCITGDQTPNHYYYEVCNGYLYIKANTLIAQKMVAVVKYKPAFFGVKEVTCQ